MLRQLGKGGKQREKSVNSTFYHSAKHMSDSLNLKEGLLQHKSVLCKGRRYYMKCKRFSEWMDKIGHTQISSLEITYLKLNN